MGILSWLSRQLDDLDFEPPAPSDDGRANDHRADNVEFPEFQGVLTTHLDADLEAFVEQLASADDRAYGDVVLRALRNDGVDPPAMPDDVLRIQRLLSEPDCDVTPLAAAITKDPSIAGRFVGIANSPLYARADRVRSVDEAVIRIGMRQTTMIVMAIVSKTKLFRAPSYEQQARELHRHCLAAAVAGQMLARIAGVEEGHAFMGGLLHDIGRVWFLSMSADVTRQSRGKRKVSLATIDALSDRFHAGFSAMVTESWGFEDSLVSAIMFHHAPSVPGPDYNPDLIPDHARALTYTLAGGDLLSHAILNPDEPTPVALTDIGAELGVEINRELQRDCWEAFIAFEQQLS